MDKSEILGLAKLHAEKYGLDPRFVAAIIAVESGGNPWACRYEPGFFDAYLKTATVAKFGAVSTETERTMRATSFGLMQVMGQVAREHGFKGVFLSELCEPHTGTEFGCKYLSWLKARLFADGHVNLETLAAAYNGGLGAVKGGTIRNPKYPAKVLAAMD